VSSALAPFAAVAVSMIVVTIFVLGKVLPSRGRPPLVTQMTLALAVLGGGSVLLLALVFVFLNPDGTAAWTWVLLAFNFMMMGPAGIWFIGLIVFRDRRVEARDWTWPIALALVTTGSEALMGFLFALGGESTPTTTLATLSLGLSSVWFFWSMAVIMAALVLWAPLAPVERWALVALTGTAAIAPWITSYPTVGGIAMTALMGAILAYLVRTLGVRSRARLDEVGLLIGLAVAFLAMALAGLALVATGGSVAAVLAFGTVMGVVMGVEIAYLVRRYYIGSPETPWLSRADDNDSAEAGRPLAPSSGPVPGPRAGAWGEPAARR
jgi:hypothetical protein